MAAPNTSNRTAVAALALSALAGVVFIAGTGRAIAPEQACVPQATGVAEPEAAAVEPLDAAQRVLADHFAKRYYIANDATRRWVAAAYRAAAEVGLDPLLVLAVISVESRFNPVAESVMGAKGLMQIIPKFHRAKLEALGGALEGDAAALDPETNIRVGVRILQEYVYRTGTLEAGLQYYNGAAGDETAQYAQRVLAERSRIDALVRVSLKTALARN